MDPTTDYLPYRARKAGWQGCDGCDAAVRSASQSVRSTKKDTGVPEENCE